MPKAAIDNVTECASVKAVTTLAMLQKAPAKSSTGSHLSFLRVSTAGSRRVIKNKMWS